MAYPILDPTGTITPGPDAGAAPRARRRRDLHGAVVGLLVNTKQNAAPFLDEVGRLLAERYGHRDDGPHQGQLRRPRA
jgi:hypothetical protein